MRARVATLLLLAALTSSAIAQVQPPPTTGSAALELMLRKLGTTGTVMITNAHPDDENNALIAALAHGQGIRVVEATATRGEGGQNDLGTEQGLPLSVLRTEELLAAHKIDGAEQFFARAVDFGYSFSVEETYEKWGKEEILADYVRLIRMVRPDVIITMSPDGGGGGQHHQASARITREAFDAAADPAKFPDQIAAGLRPWKTSRLYVPLGAPPPADEPAASRPESRTSESVPASRRSESAPTSRPGDVTIDLDVYDAVLGATYNEIGTLARSMHKSQGMARLLALPGPAVARFRIAAGTPSGPDDIPADATPLSRWVAELGAFSHIHCPPSGDLGRDLQSLRREVEIIVAGTEARRAFEKDGMAACLASLVRGLRAVRAYQSRLERRDPEAVHDAQLHLARQESKFVQAIQIASGLRFDALSDDGTVVPGQEVKVSVFLANRAGAGVQFERVTFAGFEYNEGGCATRPSGPIATGGLVRCESKLRVPKDAPYTSAHWKRVPGTSRSEWEPDVPFGAPFRPTPFRAKAHLIVAGEPVTFDVPVEYRDGSDALAGEKRHEILVVPPPDQGGFQRIEYLHTKRRHLVGGADSRPLPQAGLSGPLRVGYLSCVADAVDESIRRLGVQVDLLDEMHAEVSPSTYPVIVIGMRACELRSEVREYARRLRQYVEQGGTMIVLYQRSGLDENSAAPYPAKTGGTRTTDENAPVKVLVPDHPVFNVPNKITAEDWAGWVQERGRNFLETKDARYVDLLELEDPFEFNKGPKRGALVEAKVGKGRWIYVGLALSRQLEEGVPGAYRLLANLLSLRPEG